MPLLLRLQLMKRGRPKVNKKRLPNGKVDPISEQRKRAYKPRRRRLLPHLKDIQELCVEVFTPWMEEAEFKSIMDFFRIFFAEDSRKIREYRCEDEFTLASNIPFKDKFVSWNPMVEGNPRQVKPGEILLLRTDMQEPHRFEVQIVKDFLLDTDDRRIFIMGPREFYDLRKNISLMGSS